MGLLFSLIFELYIELKHRRKLQRKTHLLLLMQVNISNMKKFVMDIEIYITRDM